MRRAGTRTRRNVLLLAGVLHMFFWRRRHFLEDAAFSIHVVSFVLLSSLTLMPAIRRFYLAAGRWGARRLSIVRRSRWQCPSD